MSYYNIDKETLAVVEAAPSVAQWRVNDSLLEYREPNGEWWGDCILDEQELENIEATVLERYINLQEYRK